jgi:hypothetical protein
LAGHRHRRTLRDLGDVANPYPELEIGLHRVQAQSYQVELRFHDPGSDAETPPRRGPCPLDLDALIPLLLDPAAYGTALSTQVFEDPAIRSYLSQVKAAVEATDRVLRLRLLVDPTAAELHAVRWELLCDPESGSPFATSERVIFSRFLPSMDWRPVRLRPKAALRALVAVAAPSNLADYGLSPIDPEAEVRRAREALAGIELEVAGVDQPLTLDHLEQGLRRGPDILYLVAHGRLKNRHEPLLLMQQEDGRALWVEGDRLAQRVADLRELPRLMVLASCEGAGTGDAPDSATGPGSAEVALAPRLAAAGVPAILAMQGKISLQTIEQAMPRYFAELLLDGQIDRALAAARGAVRDRPDAWMPALFLRLRGGRIWYEPGFGRAGGKGPGEDDAVKWAALTSDIQNKRFTPIVGWGLAEAIYGSTQDLAGRLAADIGFPLAPYQRTDLAQVSSYLLVTQGSSSYPLDAVKEQMRRQILTRFRDRLNPEDSDAKLARLLKTVGAIRREDARDPYRLLAALPAPVFITATPDNLLADALIAAGKRPDERYAYWRRGAAPPKPYDQEPTVASPLIYHSLGHFKEPDSLVLTQDDYFDYLIGASRNHALVPHVVRHALTGSSLLFLGFQLTDWSFRVLFRLILSQEGGALRKRFPHVAVQVDPEGGHLIDVEQARRYLVDCYGMDDIGLFWGSSEELLERLVPRLPVRTPEQWDQDGAHDDDF